MIDRVMKKIEKRQLIKINSGVVQSNRLRRKEVRIKKKRKILDKNIKVNEK